MDLQSFIYFNELAKELNFTRAAENLYTSQQSLSQHIKRLETHYGVELFERKPHVRLTYAGKLLLEASRQILDIENSLKAQLSYVNQNQCGIITLGLPSSRAHTFLPVLFPRFKELYPHITFSLVEGHTGALEKMLQNGELDIMIGSKHGDSRLTNPLFHYIPLLNETLYFLVADNLLKEYFPNTWPRCKEDMKHGIYMKDFMDLPLIMDAQTSRIQASVNQLFLHENRKPNLCIESNRGSSLLSLCTEGYCAVFVLQMILHSSLAEDPDLKRKVNIFPLLDHSLKNSVVLIHRQDKIIPKYLVDFISLTRDLFKRYEKIDLT